MKRIWIIFFKLFCSAVVMQMLCVWQVVAEYNIDLETWELKGKIERKKGYN